MIDPKPKDLGRMVNYIEGHLSACENGVITGFNDSYVFVMFQRGDEWTGAMACQRSQLEWFGEDFLGMAPLELAQRARHDLIAEWVERRKDAEVP